MWQLTLPQLGYYLEQCHEHIEFTIKVSSMSLGGLFGGAVSGTGSESSSSSSSSNKDDYQVATEEDMNWLSSIL
ncbi:hypothetical protein [Paenibacillus arenosi]|uniref:hypothetical protein n=1 Tax=Paenibacillus arenosi TaxID=2774142 RepID=UPI00308065F0